jgi:aspartyl-tRNA(Asn)/glutamyl-tRNA(Gln) amidotransferase subunit C
MSSFDIKNIAKLSRLSLTAEEEVAFQGDLEAIIGYVEKMAKLDLDDVEPTARAVEASDVFREDVNTPSIDRELVIANAPAEIDDELFRVPVVIEEGEC